GKCIRKYSSATHPAGTASASGSPSRASCRMIASDATQNNGITTESPSHDRYIIGCATRTQFVARKKKQTPPRYAAKYRRRFETGARTSVSHGTSATNAIGPRLSGKNAAQSSTPDAIAGRNTRGFTRSPSRRMISRTINAEKKHDEDRRQC